ncbi:putative fasciclin-like arabinogalactan protein 20 [Citrus sinensis]|uniref:Fasciclin-like arabinogalactan protein 20 n=1 Tax=Citrus sinensis TaxID=2711 RepID=A0ACB8N1G5_CITSI|nr:putative fasciclin-like arabinogalactan protein 20 [Citrus sinensis]
MSSENDGARKKKKIEKLPLAKISRKLRDKHTFHVGGSSSQAVIPNHPQQETLPLLAVTLAMYPPSVNSSFTSNISVSTPFPSYSSQGTLLTMEDLPSFAWEDSTKTYINSFNQFWPQYISSNDVRHIESCDPIDVMLNNICQLKENYENLKTDYDNLRAQSQSEIQDLSNSLNQLNLQMSTAKASAMKEYKTSAEFANIIDDEFFKGAAKVKAMMESHYPHIDYSFLEVSPGTLSNAVETLSNSGYLSMALTLQITFKTLNLESKTLTIFSPSDFSFSQSGQLSLSQLQYHISPSRLSQDSLKTLAFGSRLPTLLSNHSLIVTVSDFNNAHLSINGVLIQESPMFDQEELVVYGIDEFFNSSFGVMISPPPHSAPVPSPVPSPIEPIGFDVDVFGEASDLLNSRGYTLMATFLDMQLARFTNQTRLTIFAPVDAAMEPYVKNITDCVSIFKQHVVLRLLRWQDLIRLNEGTTLPTSSEGFKITVAYSGDVILLNGVPVVFPDMYSSNWLVVHGLNSLLAVSPLDEKIIGDSFSELNGDDYQSQADYGR